MFSKKFVCAQTKVNTCEEHTPAPLIRKSFTLEILEGEYHITISGLGFYRLFINGKEITKGYFAPYISNPDDVVYYDEYDVTALLQKGKNVIGIILGNGLQNSLDNNIWLFESAPWRSAPKVAFCVENNGKMLFESDLSVKCFESPIRFDDLRCGEHYDANYEIDDWASIDFDDSDWKQAEWAEAPLGEAKTPDVEPIVCYNTLYPVEIIKGKKGYIYDFGEVNAGICKMQGTATKGQEITLIYGEIVIDGEVDLKNIAFGERSRKGYIQQDIYTARGGEFTYVPSFTYHGFRYVEVQGISEEQATKDLLTYLVLGSDLKQIGTFTCDNEDLNKIQECTYRSDRSNIFYFPLDCPQREKNGWTGDTALSAEQFMYNLSAEKSLAEWLCNIRKAQNEEGQIPGIIPTAGWGYHWGHGPGWDLVMVEIPYRIYQFRGDLQPAKESMSAFDRYLDCAVRKLNESGLASYGLGDWCEPGTLDEGKYTTPNEITDSTILSDICNKIAYLSEKTGNELLREKALLLAANLREKFRAKYIRNGLFISNETQTAYAVALYYGFFNDDEKATAYNRLKELIKQKDNHFYTGVLGSRILFHLLSDMGDSALAIKLITQKTYPSYTYHLDRGATTLWEAFYEQDDSVSYPLRADGNPRMISLNHHFWGFVSGWFYSHLAGIKFDETKVYVSPCLDCGLNYVKATYNPVTPVEVEWEKIDNEYRLTIIGDAEFVVPGGYIAKEEKIIDDKKCYIIMLCNN